MKLHVLSGFLQECMNKILQTYVGLSQSLLAVWTPAPQVLEQADHSLHEAQPPSTLSGWKPTGTQSPLIHHCKKTPLFTLQSLNAATPQEMSAAALACNTLNFLFKYTADLWTGIDFFWRLMSLSASIRSYKGAG